MSKRKADEPVAEEPPAKEAKIDEEIEWFAFDPPHRNDLEIVQGTFGIKCIQSDIERLKSPYLDTLLEMAQKDGTQRILVAEDTFTSLLMMKEFFESACFNRMPAPVFSTEYTVPMLKAALAMDLCEKPFVRTCKRGLLDASSRLSTDDKIAYGKLFGMPSLIQAGAQEYLGNEYTKGVAIPDHILSACLPIWMEMAGKYRALGNTVEQFASKRRSGVAVHDWDLGEECLRWYGYNPQTGAKL